MSFVNGYVNIAINCNIIATPDSAKKLDVSVNTIVNC